MTCLDEHRKLVQAGLVGRHGPWSPPPAPREVTFKQLRDLRQLSRGSIIQHRASGNSYVVEHTDGERVYAVRSMTVTNPAEWLIVEAPR